MEPNASLAPAPAPSVTPAERTAVWLVGLGFAAAVLARLDWANGPWYHKWIWRDLPLPGTACLFLIPFVVIFLVAYWIDRDDRMTRVGPMLAALTMAHVGLQLAGLMAEPGAFEKLRKIVVSANATSYYTDAARIEDWRVWLSGFHEARLELHSATHPPGPILYYYFLIRVLGNGAAAVVGGSLVGIAGSLGIPLLYTFSSLWTDDPKTRLTACLLFALAPGLIVFLPEFDQAYPLLSMALMLLWARGSLGSRVSAVGFGAALFSATIFAYNLLILGLFMVLFSAWQIRIARASRDCWMRHLRAAALALGVFLLLHLVFALATGYSPLRSFLHALENQGLLQRGQDRPYLYCILFNLADFFLGSGMITLPLLLQHLDRTYQKVDTWSDETAMTLVGLGTILCVNFSGLLNAETARVWLFLQPLVVVPVAIQFRRLESMGRWGFLGLLACILVILKARMDFIIP